MCECVHVCVVGLCLAAQGRGTESNTAHVLRVCAFLCHFKTMPRFD